MTFLTEKNHSLDRSQVLLERLYLIHFQSSRFDKSWTLRPNLSGEEITQKEFLRLLVSSKHQDKHGMDWKQIFWDIFFTMPQSLAHTITSKKVSSQGLENMALLNLQLWSWLQHLQQQWPFQSTISEPDWFKCTSKLTGIDSTRQQLSRQLSTQWRLRAITWLCGLATLPSSPKYLSMLSWLWASQTHSPRAGRERRVFWNGKSDYLK